VRRTQCRDDNADGDPYVCYFCNLNSYANSIAVRFCVTFDFSWRFPINDSIAIYDRRWHPSGNTVRHTNADGDDINCSSARMAQLLERPILRNVSISYIGIQL